MPESFKSALSEKIEESIEGQEPSWKNYLSREVINSLANDESVKNRGSDTLENTEPLTVAPSLESIEKNDLGTNFESMISAIAEKSPPPELESEGVLATLITNEHFDPEKIRSNLRTPPDGYIFGVGAGNIYSLVHLFDSETPPKAILSVDIIPDVVLAGRVAVQLMKKSNTFNEFLLSIQSEQTFNAEVLEAINNESSEVVKQRLQSVDAKELFRSIRGYANNIPSTGIEKWGGIGNTVSVFAAIRDRWDVIQKLAKDGNIGIGLADITNKEVLQGVLNSEGFNDSSNVIYMTNIIDHITERGTEFGENDERLGFTKPLEVLDNGKSIYVDTTQGNYYELRASPHLPVYTRDDCRVRGIS